MINTNNLRNFANKYYDNKDIMHDLSHVDRVLKYVENLTAVGNYNVDGEVLTYAMYFHGFIYNREKEIITWLQTQGVSDNMIDKILKAAWESQKDKEARTLEGKILHDAHMIEGGKTYLIVKSLITGSVRGQTLEETIIYIENNILGKGVCYLPEAQKIYDQQQEFAKNFIKDLKEGLL